VAGERLRKRTENLPGLQVAETSVGGTQDSPGTQRAGDSLLPLQDLQEAGRCREFQRQREQAVSPSENLQAEI